MHAIITRKTKFNYNIGLYLYNSITIDMIQYTDTLIEAIA